MSRKNAIKQKLIGAGFAALGATRLHRVVAPLTRGQGAIVMLHHVRPWGGESFAPNRLLEIEPDFLDTALHLIRARGFDFVSMDEVGRRIGRPGQRPFVALTFDDGYRDCLDHALPILERHAAPFALYVTTGFADRSARLWWVELEEALQASSRIDVTIAGERILLPCVTSEEKSSAFETIYWALREGPNDRLLETIGRLAAEAGVSSQAIPERLCLDWDDIRRLARHPLCTIGVHTSTHPMLAKHPADLVHRELSESRARIEREIGLPARHLSYPIGDAASAGPRDYAIAAELGFASAVTTRPGMIFGGHRDRRTALPRLSINGKWQTRASLDVLLSGVPFAIWNGGRRVVA